MWALLSLAIGSFGIGMTEFVAMGLLPEHRPGPAARPLGAEPGRGDRSGRLADLAVRARRRRRRADDRGPRREVPAAPGDDRPRDRAHRSFNALTVVLPTFEPVGLARFLAGLPHGAYFGIGALVAADVLGPGKRAKGVAFILTGLTIANVVGVPAGHVPRPAVGLAQRRSWSSRSSSRSRRSASRSSCPQHAGDPGAHLPRRAPGLPRPQVWLTLGDRRHRLRRLLRRVQLHRARSSPRSPGRPQWIVPIIARRVGLGMTVGNLLGGHFADLDLRRTLLIGLGAMAGRARAARDPVVLDLAAGAARVRRSACSRRSWARRSRPG